MRTIVWFPFVLMVCLCGCEEKIKPSVVPIDEKDIPSQESWNSTVTFTDSGKVKAAEDSKAILELVENAK